MRYARTCLIQVEQPSVQPGRASDIYIHSAQTQHQQFARRQSTQCISVCLSRVLIFWSGGGRARVARRSRSVSGGAPEGSRRALYERTWVRSTYRNTCWSVFTESPRISGNLREFTGECNQSRDPAPQLPLTRGSGARASERQPPGGGGLQDFRAEPYRYSWIAIIYVIHVLNNIDLIFRGCFSYYTVKHLINDTSSNAYNLSGPPGYPGRTSRAGHCPRAARPGRRRGPRYDDNAMSVLS